MDISLIDVWYTLGTIPKLFGVVGPSLAAIICAMGARHTQERWTVGVLGIASLGVPVYAVWSIRQGSVLSGSITFHAVAAGLAELLVTAPFVVAGGLAAALVLLAERPSGLSRSLLYFLTGVGVVVVLLSTTAMRSFANAAATGQMPLGMAGWIVEKVVPMVPVPTTERTIASTGVRVRTALIDDPGIGSWQIRPVIGRMPRSDEDVPVAVLSHSYWEAGGSDPGVVGSSIVLEDRTYLVLGVLEESANKFAVDIWLHDPTEQPGVAEQLTTSVQPSGVPASEVEQTYFEFQVEQPVVLLEDSPPPQYPESLRGAGIEGEVVAQYVVDSGGRFEQGSFKILRTTHDLFSQAVSDVLPKMRFLPAEIGGRKVKQLVQQSFAFSLTR
jgi:TonB family protein